MSFFENEHIKSELKILNYNKEKTIHSRKALLQWKQSYLNYKEEHDNEISKIKSGKIY